MTSKAAKASTQTILPSGSKHGSLPYKVFKQGFLLKQTHRGVIKSLKRYWFVLFQQKDMMAFLYFQDEDHFLERKKNEGFFRIEDATSINILPEYMGRKHAFNIDTPRNKYVLVSESRYEMNEWLLSLHSAMEQFKASSLGRKKSRPRTNSTSAVPSGLSASPNKTPPGVPRIKPSRPAPPAPPNKKKDEPPEVSPVDETPTSFPPDQQYPESSLVNPTSPTMHLDSIVANLLVESNNMADLNYTMNEEEEEEYEDDNIAPLSSVPTGNSKSLPTLNNGIENGRSSSPELDLETGEPISHNRYHSLSGSYEFDERSTTIPLDNQARKRVRKRPSIKGRRSVSPPNLPPPPPPEVPDQSEPTAEDKPTNEEEPTDSSSSVPPVSPNTEEVGSAWQHSGSTPAATTSKNSPQNKPKPPPPVRTTSLAPKQQQEVDTELNKYLDEAFSHEDMELLGQNKENESLGILRKGEAKTSGKRTVVFKEDDRKSQSYEPRIDQEASIPTSVREAKLKLFGSSGVEENAKYRRNSIEIKRLSGGEREKSPADELLESIETALQPTNYMESHSPPPPAPNALPPTGRRAPPKVPETKSPIPPPPGPPNDGLQQEHDPTIQTMYRSVV